MTTGPRVVVGISGGIAAYKAVSVVRALVLAGADVHVVPTTNALRFVGAPTLEATSRNPVTDDLFDDVAQVRHVALGQSADLILIVPATASTMARLATGLADDLLGTTVLASTAPVILAPAMHTEMWQHPATQANVATLRERGVIFVGPDSGQLTGDDVGPGRLADPERIAAEALAMLGALGADTKQARSSSLRGRRIVVSAGGTREPIDPVRFISNRSTGMMGVEIARAAAAAGARVTLVGANLEVPAPSSVEVVRVETVEQLRAAMLEAIPGADAVVMAAAVSDWTVAEVADHKLKKTPGVDTLDLALVRTPEILTELASEKSPETLLVGFAAETAQTEDELIALAQAKRRAKGADLLVANRVGWSAGFGAGDTAVTLIDGSEVTPQSFTGSKVSVAGRIVGAIAQAVADSPR